MKKLISALMVCLVTIALGCDNIGDTSKADVITFQYSTNNGATWSATLGNGNTVPPGSNYTFSVFLNGVTAPPWSVEQGGRIIIASNTSTMAATVAEGTLIIRVGDLSISVTVSGAAPPPGVSLRLNGSITVVNGGTFAMGTYEVSVLLDGVSQTSNWTVTDSTSALVADPSNLVGVFGRNGTYTVTLTGYNPITVYTGADELTVDMATPNGYTMLNRTNESTVDMANYTWTPLLNNQLTSGTWLVRVGDLTGAVVADNDSTTTVTETSVVDDGQCYWIVFATGSTMRIHIQMETVATMVYDTVNQQILILLPLWCQAGLVSNIDTHAALGNAAFHGTERLMPMPAGGTAYWLGTDLTMWPEVYYGNMVTTTGQNLFGRVVIRWGVAYPTYTYGFSFNGGATFNGVGYPLTVVRQTVATN